MIEDHMQSLITLFGCDAKHLISNLHYAARIGGPLLEPYTLQILERPSSSCIERDALNRLTRKLQSAVYILSGVALYDDVVELSWEGMKF